MNTFLRTVDSVDSYIEAVHFLAENDETGEQAYHYSSKSTFFKGEELFRETVGFETLDRSSRNLLLIPPHGLSYYSGLQGSAFTIARNYYDLRGAVGQSKYLGTVFIDVSEERLNLLFKKMNLGTDARYFLVDEKNICYYTSQEGLIGQEIEDQKIRDLAGADALVFRSEANAYGMRVICAVERKTAFSSLNSIGILLIWLVFAVLVILLVGARLSSRSLTKPIYELMDQMKKVETGDFDIHLPVNSQDEIGILSERFNEMSRELENYINQSYLSKLRQNEAELTALKSQIYPHFLYNTLEIIRMTALENRDENVSDMIEALSEQIHYLIGPVEDMVPLELEIGIIQKYVYLLNCRIRGKVLLSVDVEEGLAPFIPKLTLQPVIENAYVHGLKPKSGSGSIRIDVYREGDLLEIDIMDNGVGMDEKGVQKIQALFESDQPGVKNEYNWQSIGLKNVHDRIRFLYGKEYGVKVTSTVGVGTVVQIRLPYQEPDMTGVLEEKEPEITGSEE